ncbi:MAG: RnfABCDGE type electron transport complex subunit G [Oscillospiraceae bacterium]|nr:RnfABCDGE type electron transport complex subunit G [Oscillospiraceae bacterium]
MDKAKKKPASIGVLILTLFLVTAVMSGLLGLVNYVTKDRIAAFKAESMDAAMREVLPADSYTEVEYGGGDALVSGVWEAGGGYVVEVTPSGFGGEVDMMVGVDADGRVTGVSIVSMSETSGLGSNASKPEFRAQYAGKAEAALTKDGGDIDALTGATVTSRAVTRGVNAALAAAEYMRGGAGK